MRPKCLPASIFERFFHSEIANCKWSPITQPHRRFFHNQPAAGKTKNMSNYDRNIPTDAEVDAAMARFGTVSSRNRLESLMEGYAEYGYTKPHAMESIIVENLRKDIARGAGNAAQRRLKRLQDEAEARAYEQEFYERNRLPKADYDAILKEYFYNATHEV
jgi:hypothetical protein